ncbi:MAG: cytochrome c-type biogenesis protein CcmH [Thiotrichaceae bacterium]|nr:cytochrome c-type biogenesis protein CcmH [Thiotrichaceae bacterium]PCI12444.1 MAG: cytochrome C biogenesis protein CcmH [Thiotrichales bacterium]
MKCRQGMGRTVACLMLLSAMVVSPLVQAKEATLMQADAVLEKRVMALAYELRCLVCQNQSLGDSHSKFAIDMRTEIRDQMRLGQDDEQVTEFMVQRYGDFIRFRPPVKSTTYLLWFGPFILLALGAVVLFISLKIRKRTVKTMPMSDEDRKRADALLGDK